MVTKTIRTSLCMLMVALLLAGCVRLALQFSPSLIPHMTETLFEECDPELARQSLPADLKLMEGLLKNDPNNRRLLTALCIGFTGYSLLFVEEENQERASKQYLRAMDYGARVLGPEMGSFEEFTADTKTLQRNLMSLGEAEHVALFWFAMSWNAWINLNRDQPAALAQLGSAQSCVERVLQIKPDYLYGAPYILMGSILAERPRMLGGGEMGFRIYAGGIAGDEIDVLKKIRIGQIHSAAFSGVGFGQILPMVRVLDLPFLFRSYEETDRVHLALKPFFTDAFKDKGFELLAWAEVGNVHLFSQKPIRRVKDLRGLKVWTWSGDPIAKATFSHMGVNPIPLSYPDVSTALNTGMIDTVYAPPLTALVLQWHTYLTYMTALPLAHSTGAVLISSKYYDTLPNGLASLLRNSFELAMGELTDALRKQTSETMELMKKSGLTIVPRPPGEALGEFYGIHERVARELAGTIYPKGLLDRVYENLERHR